MNKEQSTAANARQKTAQEFLNIAEIKNDFLVSQSNYIFGYLYVKTKDAKLLSEAEKEKFYNGIASGLEEEKEPWQLISIPRVVNTNGLIEHLLKIRRQTRNPAKLDLINEEIASLKSMAREGVKEPLIFMKLWRKNDKNAESELAKRLANIRTVLTERGVQCSIFNSKDITYLCKLYADLGEHQSMDNDYTADMPVLEGDKKRKSKQTDEQLALISMLTPVGGITFKNNKLIIGSTTARCYGATNFPSTLSYAWAVKAMNSTEAITCITYSLKSSNQLADALSSSIKRNIRDAGGENDARARKRLEKQAEDADNLISQLDEQGEAIGQISVLVMPFADDEAELDAVCRRVISNFTRIKMKVLGQLQKEAFRTLSPYFIPEPDILNCTLRIMPLKTLIGGSPMTVNVFKDDNGFYFAKTLDGGLIALDVLKRGEDRTNSNFVVTGKAGTGKSTAIKHIIESLFMLGVKIVIIDPEREYRDLCKNLGGAWIDCGGGNAKINILQVKPVPMDEEEDLTDALFTGNTNDLAMHMKTLEIFFNTYIPSLTDINKSLLKKAIIEIYEKFNITWETNVLSLAATDFPIMLDLYNLIAEKSKTDAAYKELAALLYDIALGADSFLWNGYTNIDTNNDFICFDTCQLNNASDQVKKTQYFNILTLAWDIMSEDREQDVALVCDEAYILVDPKVPQSLMFLRNISKRGRKYKGMLAVISHSLVDFLDPAVKMYGQALLEMPTYKLFFGTDGQNLKDTTELYNLSEPEQEILQMGVRGEALAFIGNQRLKVKFELPPYKLMYMGKGGGT
ncbi:MAG: ATP-binding protein [Oscillospiraceae bacterium]